MSPERTHSGRLAADKGGIMKQRLAVLIVMGLMVALFLPNWMPFPCFKAPCITGHGCLRGDIVCQEQQDDETPETEPSVNLQPLVDLFYIIKPPG
jgi:hypothetical protein